MCLCVFTVNADFMHSRMNNIFYCVACGFDSCPFLCAQFNVKLSNGAFVFIARLNLIDISA